MFHLEKRLKEEEQLRWAMGKFHELDKRFKNLSCEAQTEISRRQKLTRVKQVLTRLTLDNRGGHSGFLQQNRERIFVAKSVEEIFNVLLNPYWSFLDFSLLEYLVRELGSFKLQTKVSDYRSELTRFKKMATVFQVALLSYPIVQPPPKACKLSMVLQKNASEFTLEELDKLRERFCSVVLLSNLTMIITDVNESPVRVTWFLPAAAASHVTAAIRFNSRSFFNKHEILRIELDRASPFVQRITGKFYWL